VNIDGTEAANDVLTIRAGAGNDTISAAALPAAIIGHTIDGGAGNDTITGSQGNDTLIGGDGNDFVNDGKGNDTAVLGAGDDAFVWNPGDGSDVVDGGAGTDTLQFNGANIAEKIDITANGSGAARATTHLRDRSHSQYHGYDICRDFCCTFSPCWRWRVAALRSHVTPVTRSPIAETLP
jgi:Ca2+-binding RTX toxin-like protein